MAMNLYNTLSRTIEEFNPLNPPNVTIYSCGPTVYDYTHIGHMRKYVNDDVLKKSLVYLGYKVKHVMNITDVGHLTSDEDAGEDKLEKGAQKTGQTVWEVAQFYTDYFFKTTDAVHVARPDVVPKATEHIPQMVELIQKLETKGYTYQTDEAVYFDVTKFPQYGALSGQKLDEKKQGARGEVIIDAQKKHPADFALWFKRVGRFADHTMHWDSPWGDGFPGWHIECSAMSMQYLGETIDIHTGGIDHIPVHHENEIAQSQCATGKQFVRYWVHHEFLQVEGQKMSKSLNNFFTIDDILKKGLDPLAMRLLFLQTHYRQPMNFTWESAQAAQEAYKKLKDFVLILKSQTQRTVLSDEKLNKLDAYRSRFQMALENDLQLPQAVAVMWELIKSSVPSEDKIDLLYEFDQILGLGLQTFEEEKIPDAILKLVTAREEARKAKDFAKSDELRNQISEQGYVVEDSSAGYKVKKK